MILKIQNKDGSFVMYDDIVNYRYNKGFVISKKSTKENEGQVLSVSREHQFEACEINYDGIWLDDVFHDRISSDKWETNIFHLNFANGSTATYVADTAYILNNDGKTLEIFRTH